MMPLVFFRRQKTNVKSTIHGDTTGLLGSDGHHVRHPEVDAISLVSLTASK